MADKRAERIAELIRPLRVRPGARGGCWPRTSTPASQGRFVKKKDGMKLLRRRGSGPWPSIRPRLAAQDTYGVLVVTAVAGCGRQGRDDPARDERGESAGRDRPQTQKVPSAEDLAHDYLWHYVKYFCPAGGEIGIFNRSHYEEVLVVRVHPECPHRQRLPPAVEAARAGGNAVTGRSTTGSTIWRTTGS